MRVIAIVNQKGGCGKTTTTVNLAGALAEEGHRVLVVDMDPQAHATLALGLEPDDLESNLYEVLIEPAGVRTGIWEQVERSTEEHAASRYAGAYRRSLATTRLSQPLMRSPESVARVIARALESRAPRARYLIGADAQALALVERLAPTALKDRVSRLVLGL